MKLGDMTFKQIVEICTNHKCNRTRNRCPFYNEGIIINCLLLQHCPAFQNLDMEVKADA